MAVPRATTGKRFLPLLETLLTGLEAARIKRVGAISAA